MRKTRLYTFVVLVLCTVLLFNSESGYSQSQMVLKGRVLDSLTQAKVCCASITVVNSGFGVICDNEGYFELTVEDSSSYVEVMSFGYKPRYLTAKEIGLMFDISLTLEVYDLPLVEVSSSRIDVDDLMLKVISKYRKGRSLIVSNVSQVYAQGITYLGAEPILYFENFGFTGYFSSLEGLGIRVRSIFVPYNVRYFISEGLWVRDIPKAKLDKIGMPFSALLLSLGSLESVGVLSEDISVSRFKLDSILLLNNREIVKVKFTSKSNGGYIYVDIVSLKILKIELTEWFVFSFIFGNEVRSHGVVEFIYYDGIPYLSTIEVSYEKRNVVEKFRYSVMQQYFGNVDISVEEFSKLEEYSRFPFVNYEPKEFERKGRGMAGVLDEVYDRYGNILVNDYFHQQSNKWFREDTVNEYAHEYLLQLTNLFK